MLTRYLLRSHTESPNKTSLKMYKKRVQAVQKIEKVEGVDDVSSLWEEETVREWKASPHLCDVFGVWVWDGCFLLPAGVHPSSLPTQHDEQSVSFFRHDLTPLIR